MHTLQNEIWLEFKELLDVGISEKTLKMGFLRNSPKWQSIKDPTDGRKRLIRYSTLGESYKEAVRAELCGGLEPSEWVVMLKEQAKQDEQLGKRAALVDNLEDMCQESYRRYMHLYRGSETRQQRYLSRSAGIIVVLSEWYKVNGIDWKSYEPVKQAAAWIEQNKTEFFPKNGLPTHPTRLKEKVLSYAVEGMKLNEVVSLHRTGNENRATKKNEMWWQSTAVTLHTSGRNMTMSAITRKVYDLSLMMDNEAPSETTVRNLLKQTNFITADKRMDLNNKHLHRQRASMPIADALFPGACWEMDGTRVQLAPHQTKDGLKFLYVIGCRDVYSGAWLGWHFATSESGHAYRMALKMAVNLTGRVPYELRYDRFPGHNTQEIEHLFGELENLGVKLTITSKATGKAKTERGFYTLQQVFESDHLAYWGQGIRSTTATAHPTEAYRYQVSRELKNSGWDFDAAWMAECGVIAAYNHTPLSRYSRKHPKLHLSPWELYQNAESEAEGRRIEVYEIADLFWATRQEGIRNRCIKMIIKGQTYRYDLIENEHYNVLSRYQAKDVKLTVKYDPADLGKIMLFDASGNFLCEVAEQESIQLYGSDAQWNKAAEWKEKNKAIDVRRRSELDKYLEQLPAEAAALMPTKLSKKVSEDAQTAYLLNNADDWNLIGASEKKSKAKVPVMSNLDDIDLDKWVRDQY